MRLLSMLVILAQLAGLVACDEDRERARLRTESSEQAGEPGAGDGEDFPIKHVVFIIKENRTFDHYFGRYPGADGATEGGTSTGETIPLRPAQDFLGHDLGHSFFDGLIAINGGRMDGFDLIKNGYLLSGYSSSPARRCLPIGHTPTTSCWATACFRRCSDRLSPNICTRWRRRPGG